MTQQPLVVTSFDNLKFLAIDDDRAILELVEAFLQMSAAGSVTRAMSCLAALNILADQSRKVDCIICDYGMAGMSGLEFLREVRAGRHPNIPRDIRFIMLTAHGKEDVVRAAIALDVSGYVMKPITKDMLVKAIHRAFARAIPMKSPDDYAAVPLPAAL